MKECKENLQKSLLKIKRLEASTTLLEKEKGYLKASLDSYDMEQKQNDSSRYDQIKSDLITHLEGLVQEWKEKALEWEAQVHEFSNDELEKSRIEKEELEKRVDELQALVGAGYFNPLTTRVNTLYTDTLTHTTLLGPPTCQKPRIGGC